MSRYRYAIEPTGNGRTSHRWLALVCIDCRLQLHTTTPNRAKFDAYELQEWGEEAVAHEEAHHTHTEGDLA